MTKVTLRDIFSYEDGVLNLSGFPDTEIVRNLENVLGGSLILKSNRVRIRNRSIVDPGFSPKHIKNRQEFFQQIDDRQYKLDDKFFEKIDEIKVRAYSNNKYFLEICNYAEEIKNNLRKELLKLDNVNEAKNILSKLDKFDSDLEGLLKTIHLIDNLSTFYIDIEKGIIAPVPAIPSGIKKESYTGIDSVNEDKRVYTRRFERKNRIESDTDTILRTIFYDVKLRSKRKAIRISKQMKLNFKEKLIQFVKKEFRFSEKRNNMRKDYETLLLPIKIWKRYDEFLRNCERNNIRLFDIEREDLGHLDIPSMHIPDAIYPKFSNQYSIKGLFPLKIMDKRSYIDGFVPINFKANPSEKKFLLAGLHSGGKSFFLENIIITSLVGQVGLKIPAEKLTLPKYNHLFYFKSDEGKYSGRLESELDAVKTIIKDSGKGDLIVLDEFLDSTSSDIANWLGSSILDKLLKSKATVFVSSHRNTNYKKLQKQGWIVLSPDHKIEDGEVKPTYVLSRKIPDDKINRKYVGQLYDLPA